MALWDRPRHPVCALCSSYSLSSVLLVVYTAVKQLSSFSISVCVHTYDVDCGLLHDWSVVLYRVCRKQKHLVCSDPACQVHAMHHDCRPRALPVMHCIAALLHTGLHMCHTCELVTFKLKSASRELSMPNFAATEFLTACSAL